MATGRWVRSDRGEWVSEEDPSGPVFRAKQGGPSHRQTYRCNRDIDGKTAEKEKRKTPDKQTPTHTHTHTYTHSRKKQTEQRHRVRCVLVEAEKQRNTHPHTPTHVLFVEYPQGCHSMILLRGR